MHVNFAALSLRASLALYLSVSVSLPVCPKSRKTIEGLGRSSDNQSGVHDMTPARKESVVYMLKKTNTATATDNFTMFIEERRDERKKKASTHVSQLNEQTLHRNI